MASSYLIAIFDFKKRKRISEITFASFLISAKFVSGRALAFGASWKIDAVVRTTEIGQVLIRAFVNVAARLVVANIQHIAGRAGTVGRSFRIDASMRTPEIVV